MSFNDEDRVVPWVGPMSCKNTLTIIVLSQIEEVIQKISEALTEVHSKGDFRWKLIVLRAADLQVVVNKSDITGRIAIDFVVVAIDTTKMCCLDWANEVLDQVHPDLRCRRTVLVNAGGSPMNAMAVQAVDLLYLKNSRGLDILSANVNVPEAAISLARKLLKYMEVSIGVKTGVPNINL